jgi:drug/metabolite transporter (DMT)-like permease
MQKSDVKSHLQLHLIVFIWGFTAVLGDLISVKEVQLVWFRMLLAAIFLFLYIKITKRKIKQPLKEIVKLAAVGILITLHWIYFFKAIKVSNVSITLAVFATGSFFASLLEPLFFKRRIIIYEVLFGFIIVCSLGFIMNVEIRYIDGILYALFSIILGALFTILNGKLIQKLDPIVLTFYEFITGVIIITAYLIFSKKSLPDVINLSSNDWILLLVLSTICTAYAFTASVNVMKKLSPYTVLLATNLEPVYGIFLAYFIIGNDEKMSVTFYIVALIIVLTIIANGLLKNYFENKKKNNLF